MRRFTPVAEAQRFLDDWLCNVMSHIDTFSAGSVAPPMSYVHESGKRQ